MTLPSTWHGVETNNILDVLIQSSNKEAYDCDTGSETDKSDSGDSVSSVTNSENEETEKEILGDTTSSSMLYKLIFFTLI
jgi:hypothetical protein